MNPSTYFKTGNCKYIYGDKPDEYVFCGHKHEPYEPYCAEHGQIVWRKRIKAPKPKGVSRLQVLSFREVRVWA